MTFNAAKWLDRDEFMIFVARHIQNNNVVESRKSNSGQPRSRSHPQNIVSAPIIKREPTPDSLQDLLDCAVPDGYVSACRQKGKTPILVGGSSAQSRDVVPIQSPEVIEISDSEESNLPPKEYRKRKRTAVPDR